MALAREARSAITEALQHILSTYEDMGAHPIPASMQGELLDTILAELEREAEREAALAPARLAGLYPFFTPWPQMPRR